MKNYWDGNNTETTGKRDGSRLLNTKQMALGLKSLIDKHVITDTKINPSPLGVTRGI